MQDSKQLNVKLPSELYDRIIKTGRSRKDVIVDALDMYFDVKEHNQQQEPQPEHGTTRALISQLDQKDLQISGLHKQIEQLHILLQTELSKNVLKDPDQDKHNSSWWKFWSR